VLLCGSSGGGKSTLTSALLEQLTEREYQYCVIDPEGDFPASPGRIVLGDCERSPDPEEVIKALGGTPAGVIVNLLAVALERRPAFAGTLLRRLRQHQAQWGRPHWVVVDEAHHMLSKDMAVEPDELHDPASSLLLVTVHPDRLEPGELTRLDTIIVVGGSAAATLHELQAAHGFGIPDWTGPPLPSGSGLVWSRQSPTELNELCLVTPRQERRRHQRKYATGELGPDKSFYFRGPHGALNLRAHNLFLFLQLGDGLDPDTWNYHLERNDYSRWLREAVKDQPLAEEVRRIEGSHAPADESRPAIRRAIEQRYTLPA
jgi:GTPase SAR1 family protein